MTVSKHDYVRQMQRKRPPGSTSLILAYSITLPLTQNNPASIPPLVLYSTCVSVLILHDYEGISAAWSSWAVPHSYLTSHQAVAQLWRCVGVCPNPHSLIGAVRIGRQIQLIRCLPCLATLT